jgi:hypothetical protein
MRPSDDRKVRGGWLSFRSRWIALHFIWTTMIAARVFPLGSAPFECIILANAGIAMMIASARRENWRMRQLTLWDEVAAFIALAALSPRL